MSPRTASQRRLRAAVRLLPLLLAAALLHAAPAGAQTPAELVDKEALRVCADPANLPFSNEQGQGFENKVAELLAERLKLPLEYRWYPQSVGFVVNTLRARECDLVMGVASGYDMVQNSNPYYRSTYVMVVRQEDKERLASLDSPDVATSRIGLIAGTPPGNLLLSRNLMGHAEAYHLVIDTRAEQPARDMLADLVRGDIDVALLWGPIAGYWAKEGKLPVSMAPLPSDARSNVKMDYYITLGMRQGEPEWKRLLNSELRALAPKIREILLGYGVPLLDERGNLITAAAAPSTVPEPATYRADDYRSPTPATLAGATVVDTPALQALIGRERPVLVDVLPKVRKPKGRDDSQLWIEPKRNDIPGSVWLPNVGYAEIGDDFRRYFIDQLAGLTGGDKAKPVVFYCDEDCWMSWNAAKRALTEFGYSRVFWYPEGTQGWQRAGLALAPASEAPMPDWAG